MKWVLLKMFHSEPFQVNPNLKADTDCRPVGKNVIVLEKEND